MHCSSGFFDIPPAVVVTNCDAGCVGQVAAVHDHRRFTVEWRCIKRALVAQTCAHGGQDVFDVVISREVQRLDPAGCTPDWGFLHADVDDVILTATGGSVGCDLLAQNAFFQRHPVQGYAGFGSVCLGDFLHVDHVTVVHDRNCQLLCACSRCKASSRGQRKR